MTAGVAGVTSAVSSAGAASGAIGTFLAYGVTKWVGVGALFLAAGVGSFHVTGAVWHPPPNTSSVVARPKVLERQSPSKSTPGGNAASPEPIQSGFIRTEAATVRLPALATNALPRQTLGAHSAAAPVAEHPAVTSATSLTEELDRLDRARARLATGDPIGTLVSLDAYAREFPNGGLQPEAMLLRIQALNRSGQRTNARDLGTRFLVLYPTSPHAKRIRFLIQSNQEDAGS